MRKQDLTGNRYGRLLVIKQGPHKGQDIQWYCRCDCGKKTLVTAGRLRCGQTQSCGCLWRERWLSSSTTHGLSKTREYRAWCHAKSRCECPTDKKFRIYGARGIAMCPRWRNNFAAFMKDMGPAPAGYTLDRIKNDKGYEPGNCKWSSKADQGRNTSRIHKIRGPNGSFMSIRQASKILKIKYPTALKKWHELGQSFFDSAFLSY